MTITKIPFITNCPQKSKTANNPAKNLFLNSKSDVLQLNNPTKNISFGSEEVEEQGDSTEKKVKEMDEKILTVLSPKELNIYKSYVNCL